MTTIAEKAAVEHDQFEAAPKGEVFDGRSKWSGVVRDEYTLINTSALARKYELEDAYKIVRNLEFKPPRDEKFELQTFVDYKKWWDKLDRSPKLDAEKQTRPSAPYDESYLDTYTPARFALGKMLVLVDSALYSSVQSSIDTYVIDLARDGYWADVYTVNGGTPPLLRKFLKDKSPVGAVLVGAIVAAWYDIAGDQFPCDLYYMDLTGTWSDPSGDGKFESHTGSVEPDIWISRIWSPVSGGNDAALINDYFARNHSFRQGRMGHARNALAYVDDDWTGFGDCGFHLMIAPAQITTYTTPAQTDVDLYKAEVNEQRAWSQVCAHSWVHGHAFSVSGSTEWLSNSYFRDTTPPNAYFHNLFSCGPGHFTTPDYLAGWYLFDQAGGGNNPTMTVVGSAKSGSMLFFEDFYGPMGAGKRIGDAYVAWWNARGGIHEDWEQYWFYGLSLIGDPTVNWWHGVVPEPSLPEENTAFDHWPRRTQFDWKPVDVPGATYSVEVDAFGALVAGQWAAQTNSVFYQASGLAGTSHDHGFVGMQRGRWRVRANVAGRACAWSPWSYFEYSI